uniref:WAP domain-containing protein n=1 Tax=Eptatretus burgeri TaxID=7764 RepID=A0A8C4X0D1_EPTBU
MLSLAVALIIGISIVELSHGDVPTADKKGCPSTFDYFCLLSRDKCHVDAECEFNMICCSTPCGKNCLFPIEKPGVCPGPTKFGGCAKFCSQDSDCQGREKCCSNGCGRECMNPQQLKEKPGVCPVPTKFGGCAELCSQDSDCQGKEKCCSNRCGRECMNPQQLKEKPGECPLARKFGGCARLCSHDSDCQDIQKCCSNGCGRLCMYPWQLKDLTPIRTTTREMWRGRKEQRECRAEDGYGSSTPYSDACKLVPHADLCKLSLGDSRGRNRQT